MAYSPSIKGEFIWDDDDYVSNNLALRSVEGLGEIWTNPQATPQYYPLVHTLFWVEYRLWGLSPTGYHVTNLLLHAGVAFLLWRVLALLAVPAAWVAAAVFAVHPVHVESVAWITERKNVLSGLLYLAAMYVYLDTALAEPAVEWGHRRGRYLAFCALFLLALLSKTVVATLPAALLLMIWWKRGRIGLPEIRPLVIPSLIGIALGQVTIWLERHHVGAAGIDWQLSPIERVLIAGRALWFYTLSLIWPVNLSFMYPRWVIDASRLSSYVPPALTLGLLAVLWAYRRQWGGAPLVASLLFAGTLAPALGFFDIFPMRYTFVADHYQYLASAPVIALGVASGASIANAIGASRVVVRSGICLLLTACSLLTVQRAQIFAHHEMLWTDVLDKDPGSWMGHIALGALMGRRGDLVAAERHYRDAVRLKPDFGIAQYDLGTLLANQGRYDEAIPHLREAVRLDPQSLDSYLSLGRALYLVGQPGEAAVWFRAAAAIAPNQPQLHALVAQAEDAERRRLAPAGAKSR